MPYSGSSTGWNLEAGPGCSGWRCTLGSGRLVPDAEALNRRRLMRYILSSAVIGRPGHYEYTLLTELEAEVWLKQSRFVSRVGYRERFIGAETVHHENFLCPGKLLQRALNVRRLVEGKNHYCNVI